MRFLPENNRNTQPRYLTALPAGRPERGSRTPGTGSDKRVALLQTHEKDFEIRVDGVQYFIKTVSFFMHDELRFRVIINGHTDKEHLFAWDAAGNAWQAAGIQEHILPEGLTRALNEKFEYLGF